MSERKLGIMLVDDHPVVREGLALAVQAQSDMEVVGEAGSGEEAVSLASKCNPDIVILDLRMPGIGGLASVQKIREVSPSSRIVIFTTFGEEADIIPAIEAGADGYLLKGSTAGEILNAIRAAAKGDSPIDPSAAKALISRVGKPQSPEKGPLSDREMEVLELMAQGLRNKEIASKLFITEKTVKAHVGNILAKLNVQDRTGAVTTAIRRGIVKL